MGVRENGAKCSSTLLVEEWNGQHKYESCLHSFKLCDEGEKRHHTRAYATPRFAELGSG
jgi:hypothetical protein